MQRQAVSSSNIASIGHDDETQTLEIEFRSGTVYQYFGVNRYTYSDLLKAPSPGGYFHKNIKGGYKCALVEEKGDTSETHSE